MKLLISSVVPALIAGAIAFAVAFFAPFGGADAPKADAAEEADAKDGAEKGDKKKDKKASKKKKDGKKAKGGKGGKGGKDGDPYGAGAAFVNVEPLVVSLGPNARAQYLKISISIETKPGYEGSIEKMIPKFRDVLNTYLRAVDERDLTEPAAMTKLRAQILRRIRIAADDLPIDDVLITDFILT
ncbi:MAG: flagellar basal body-associated FliL family protein [Pseudomonadota bacterium]